MLLPLSAISETTFPDLNIWALIIVIALFILYFYYAFEIYPKGRFKFINPSKGKRNLIKTINVPREMYYAMYQRGGFKNPEKSHFIIHAFKSEESRNEFIRVTNATHRKLYNENDTFVVAVTKDDTYVKQALEDVKNNPLIYNNVDYLNHRIYLEHKEHIYSSTL